MIVKIKVEKVGNKFFLCKPAEELYSIKHGKVSEFLVPINKVIMFPGVEYALEGYWTVSNMELPVFVSTKAWEERPVEEDDAVEYLRTFGISKYSAKRIFISTDFKPEKLYRKLDHDLEYYCYISRLRSREIRNFKKSWVRRSKAKELFFWLEKAGFSVNVAMQAYNIFGDTAYNVLSEDPYKLMRCDGATFDKVDEFALKNHIEANSIVRVSASILEALSEIEMGGPFINKYSKTEKGKKNPIHIGSTCLTWDELFPFAEYILGGNVDGKDIAKALVQLEGTIVEVDEDKYFFRKQIYDCEVNTARNIKRLLSSYTGGVSISAEKMAEMQDELVEKGGLPGHLSDEQQEATRTVLEKGVAVVTGGPGCGKTQIIKAMLYMMDKYLPGKTVLCMAPTGRAASRMIESTGRPACTIHSALGLMGSDPYEVPNPITEDIVIIDEFSMVDTMLADKLFSSIKSGTKVICVGDDKQLPSVGCGSVLRELLICGTVPVAVLTKVFRQKKGSAIAENAAKIKNDDTEMIHDDSFKFISVPQAQIAKTVIDTFRKEVAEFGLDNVCVLTPFRRSTETGVNELNVELQKVVFPDKDPKVQYVVGDRVMFVKNANGIANGDVGTITKIEYGEYTIKFENKEIVIDKEDLPYSIVLAYSTTIHKSQGSEYKSVILVMDERHKLMHQKNLTYTAVTRAKKKITMIGGYPSDTKEGSCEEIFAKSILNEVASLRRSRLSSFLNRDI